MTASLNNKVALVTGSSKGIGAATAKKLAAAGASVVINYASSSDAAQNGVDSITAAGGKAVAIKADLSKPQEIEQLFAKAHEAFGQLDILVNNAGIYSQSGIEDVNPEDFYRLFNLNVLGLMLATQQAVKAFGDNGGSIINISSIVANGTIPGVLTYSATKGAVNTITGALSRELGPRKIRVNAISPGMVETEGLHAAGIAESEFRTQMQAMTPLGRIGQPNDIASAVLYLASDDASWVTGQNLTVSGGVI